MRWDDIGDVRCSVARTLSVVGERWTLLVLRDAFLGVRRFDDFLASSGISPHLLSVRLNKLVEHGVLERRAYSQRPPRHEYRLTEKGLDLYPALIGLVRWGDRWMTDEHGPPVSHVHRTCGHVTRPQLTCSECGDPLDPRAVRVRLNPPVEFRQPGPHGPHGPHGPEEDPR